MCVNIGRRLARWHAREEGRPGQLHALLLVAIREALARALQSPLSTLSLSKFLSLSPLSTLFISFPSQFDPERFRTNPLPSQYHYPVFNAGPRICLGRGLALLEAKLVIAAVLHKYRLALKPGHLVTYKVSLEVSS